MLKKDFEVQILINGRPVKEYSKNGRTYIEGKKGSRYSIKVRNNSSRRIVVIPTVDGLSAIDGEYGGYNSTGYVVNGYGRITIDGWRKSDNEVAEFYFSTPGSSYSQRVGKGENKGIIGVAIFYEKYIESIIKYIPVPYEKPTPVIPWNPDKKPFYVGDDNWMATSRMTDFDGGCTFTGASFGGKTERGAQANCFHMSAASGSKKVSQKIGTGWGETKRSEVVNVPFERDEDSLTVFEIYYNTRKELGKLGVDFGRSVTYVETPTAFPNKYCNPPR